MHLDKVEIPRDYVLMGLEVGHTVIRDATEADARQISLQKSHPALRVSSVVVPREANYISLSGSSGSGSRGVVHGAVCVRCAIVRADTCLLAATLLAEFCA